MVEVELTIIFVLSLALSLLYELKGGVPFGVFAWICWWVLAWMYLAANPLVPALTWLWMGIGTIYMLRMFFDLIEMKSLRREIE